MYNHCFILLLFFVTCYSLTAQLYYADLLHTEPINNSDTNNWIRTTGTYHDFSSTKLAVGRNGEIIVAGSFREQTNFGGGIVLNPHYSLGGHYDSDIFLASYASDGKLQWVLHEGGQSADAATAVTTDDAGNIYVTGSCVAEATFSGKIVTTHGFQDMFVAKYRQNGQLLWVQRGGGKGGWCSGTGITVDGTGNVVVTGWFHTSILKSGKEEQARFGKFPLRGIPTGLHKGFFDQRILSDGFLAKYDANGNVLWATSFGGSGWDYGEAAVADDRGDIYVTGEMTAIVTTDTATLPQLDTSSMFIAKYSLTGELQWRNHFHSDYRSKGATLVMDAHGDLVIAGKFTGALDLNGVVITSAGKKDVFITKFDPAGKCLWGVRAGGADDDAINDVAIDSSGNILVAGTFMAAATFGDTAVSGYGGTDMFVASYRSNGEFDWIRIPKGVDNEKGNSIAVAPNGSIYATGNSLGDTWFGGKKVARTQHFRDVVWKLDMLQGK